MFTSVDIFCHVHHVGGFTMNDSWRQSKHIYHPTRRSQLQTLRFALSAEG